MLKCTNGLQAILLRVCMYRGMAYAGCEGSAQDQSTCPTRACPTWSDWEDWSECSATCGQGNQSRMRTCENGSGCPGSNREIRFCQLTSCPYWDEWMGWSGCSVTCGIGVCERRRRCVTDDLVNLPNLEELDEALFEMESGPADRAKSMLIARSRSEVQSSAYRNHSAEDAARRAPTRATIEGGGTCIGSDNERKPCDAGPCCSWDSWSEWSPCTGCGPQAISRRSRVCKMVESSAVFTSSSSQLDYGHIDVIGAHRLTDSYIRGPLASMTPIVPVNHRRRRQALYSQRVLRSFEGSTVVRVRHSKHDSVIQCVIHLVHANGPNGVIGAAAQDVGLAKKFVADFVIALILKTDHRIYHVIVPAEILKRETVLLRR
ncbi:thrombospondin type 1 domain protein [Necator americanus]|uniref:Thrombospondin type 1 domain protein n=1 Tax=Necator americanus TaxID=51031 RepID=W2TKN0_NECAM|nr:thrombospondin type 1 domain protein [Necator americanus]ETN82655.1 thrombospondin type 1 domain protein [Necator americanus]